MHPVKSVAVGAFLAAQIIIPLPGFVTDKLDSRADFTWNMYADVYGCDVQYQVLTESGTFVPLPLPEMFRRSDQIHRVLHADRTVKFHEWLCREVRARGEMGPIQARVVCIENGREAILVDAVDICSSPNWGVIPR